MRIGVLYFIFKILCVLNIANTVRAKVLQPTEEKDNEYISLTKNNIYEFLGVPSDNFLFNVTCKGVLVFSNVKEYFREKLYASYDLFEGFRYRRMNTDNLEDIEDVIHNSWIKENEEFIFATKSLIDNYAKKDSFILQIGLNGITPLLFKKLENIIYVEENNDVCKRFFQSKYNRCLFLFEGVEVYCKNEKSKLLSNSPSEDSIFDTLEIITKLYDKKNKDVIDILIVNHKYPVALLYYIFPYLDPSTLVILMDSLNYKKKGAILEYYDLIGEASLSTNKEKITGVQEKEVDQTKEQMENIEHIYAKMKDNPFFVITLKPKSMLNPNEQLYRSFISDEYSIFPETKVSVLIREIENNLKLDKEQYEKSKNELSHYFACIYDFDMTNQNESIRDEMLSMLTMALGKSKSSTPSEMEYFKNAVYHIKKIFQLMLYHEYEHSQFKLLFTPFIDFFKLYVDKEDTHYITYQFLIYELMKDSDDIISHELKELLFLDILRDVTKKIKDRNIDEVIVLITKLNIILKKMKSREDVQYIKEFAEKQFEVDYKNYDL